MDDDKRDRRLREARRHVQAVRAEASSFATEMGARWAPDWEDRYVARGLLELERDANSE